MKQRFNLFRLCLTALFLASVFQMKAEDVTVDSINYTLDESNLTATVGDNYEITLKTVVIPATIRYLNKEYTVTTIRESAFFYSHSITTATLPSTITTIGKQAFYHCSSLQSITVDKDNPAYTSEDGVLFNKDKTQLFCYPIEKEGASYTIPDGVKTIEEYAFYTCNLKSVVIPNSVDSIGMCSFSSCIHLGSVTFGEGVKYIGDYAFNDCNLKEFVFPNNLVTIGELAFGFNDSLQTVYISKNVETISKDIFSVFNYLTSFTVDKDNKYYASEDGVLFNKDKTQLIRYPEKKEDASYTIHDGVKTIMRGAFSDCYGLKSVVIPNSVDSIAWSSFSSCIHLGSVTFGEGVKYIGDYAFRNCDLNELVLPNNLVTIGELAFGFNDSLQTVYISKNVEKITNDLFFSCPLLTSFTVDKDNKNYTSVDGVVFNKNKTQLLLYPSGKEGNYTIPTSVRVIGEGAFKSSKITSIMIPNTVDSIGPDAFYSAKIESIVLPAGLKTIEQHTFIFSSLTSITIPDSVKTIRSDAFGFCEKLTSVIIPNSVDTIEEAVFVGCSSLSFVSAENPKTVVGKWAFFIKETGPDSDYASVCVPSSRKNSDWSNWSNTGCTMKSHPTIRNFSLSFEEGNMATAYRHYPVRIPSGVEAYTGKLDDAKTKMTLTKIETNYIPAGTPVLLFAATAGEKILAESTTDAYEPLPDNDLKGSITDIYFGETGKVLLPMRNKTDETKYCFYKTTETTVPANTAWLTEAQVGGDAVDIVFAGTTGLNDIPVDQPAAVGTDRVYNMDGTYEPNPQKGVVYIVNGKKVIYIR